MNNNHHLLSCVKVGNNSRPIATFIEPHRVTINGEPTSIIQLVLWRRLTIKLVL